MRKHLMLLLLFLIASVAASAQCGRLALNPTTGLLDCVGVPSAATGTVTSITGTTNQITLTPGPCTTACTVSLPTGGITLPSALTAGDLIQTNFGLASETWTMFNQVATTGQTSLIIRAGAGDTGSTTLANNQIRFVNNAGTTQMGFDVVNGSINALGGIEIQRAASNGMILNPNDKNGIALGSIIGVTWGSSTPSGTIDTTICRSGAGVVGANAGSGCGNAGTWRGLYQSSDGTAGVTVTTCTGFKNGLCISGT